MIFGEPMTEKAPAVLPTPPRFITEIGPLVAPSGTVAVICVAESIEGSSAGVQVRGGGLLIGHASLRDCANACREFVLWLDNRAQAVGLAA